MNNPADEYQVSDKQYFRYGGRNYSIFTLMVGITVLIACVLHRIILVCGLLHLYTNRYVCAAVLLPSTFFVVLTLVYLPVMLIFALYNRKIRYFLYAAAFFCVYLLLIIFSILADYPTLVYMT